MTNFVGHWIFCFFIFLVIDFHHFSSCFAVLMQEPQQLTERVLFSVRMMAAIGSSSAQVNPKTVYIWVKADAEEWRPTAGGHRKALTEEQVDSLCLMVEEDPPITLNALKERLLNDFEVGVSVSSIHNYLEGHLFTVKKVHYQMVEATNTQNKALRLHVEYVQRIRYAHVAKQDYHLDGWNKH